jgi:hypothetical protein
VSHREITSEMLYARPKQVPRWLRAVEVAIAPFGYDLLFCARDGHREARIIRRLLRRRSWLLWRVPDADSIHYTQQIFDHYDSQPFAKEQEEIRRKYYGIRWAGSKVARRWSWRRMWIQWMELVCDERFLKRRKRWFWRGLFTGIDGPKSRWKVLGPATAEQIAGEKRARMETRRFYRRTSGRVARVWRVTGERASRSAGRR